MCIVYYVVCVLDVDSMAFSVQNIVSCVNAWWTRNDGICDMYYESV